MKSKRFDYRRLTEKQLKLLQENKQQVEELKYYY